VQLRNILSLTLPSDIHRFHGRPPYSFLGPRMRIQLVPGGQNALECSEMHCLQCILPTRHQLNAFLGPLETKMAVCRENDEYCRRCATRHTYAYTVCIVRAQASKVDWGDAFHLQSLSVLIWVYSIRSIYQSTSAPGARRTWLSMLICDKYFLGRG
jgi:hypothetical protein